MMLFIVRIVCVSVCFYIECLVCPVYLLIVVVSCICTADQGQGIRDRAGQYEDLMG